MKKFKYLGVNLLQSFLSSKVTGQVGAEIRMLNFSKTVIYKDKIVDITPNHHVFLCDLDLDKLESFKKTGHIHEVPKKSGGKSLPLTL